MVRPIWQETAQVGYVESAIARALTGDIYRADDRALNSVNREIFAQQQILATRIRSMKPQVVLAPPIDRDEAQAESEQRTGLLLGTSAARRHMDPE